MAIIATNSEIISQRKIIDNEKIKKKKVPTTSSY